MIHSDSQMNSHKSKVCNPCRTIYSSAFRIQNRLSFGLFNPSVLLDPPSTSGPLLWKKIYHLLSKKHQYCTLNQENFRNEINFINKKTGMSCHPSKCSLVSQGATSRGFFSLNQSKNDKNPWIRISSIYPSSTCGFDLWAGTTNVQNIGWQKPKARVQHVYWRAFNLHTDTAWRTQVQQAGLSKFSKIHFTNCVH